MVSRELIAAGRSGGQAFQKLAHGERCGLIIEKDNILILAPGPINRGVELTPGVADGAHSAILNQVNNGVAVRMAVLWLVTGV